MWLFYVSRSLNMHYFVSIIVLQSSWRGKESWSLCFNLLSHDLLLLMFCSSSSRCRWLVCSVCCLSWSYSFTFYGKFHWAKRVNKLDLNWRKIHAHNLKAKYDQNLHHGRIQRKGAVGSPPPPLRNHKWLQVLLKLPGTDPLVKQLDLSREAHTLSDPHSPRLNMLTTKNI